MSVRNWIDTTPELVQDYDLAANERYEDALAAWVEGRCWAAVYVLGYVAEMRLKHGTFRVLAAAMPAPQLQMAGGYRAAMAPTINGQRKGNGHNLLYWAEALRSARQASRRPPLPGGDVFFVARIGGLYAEWTESMRYLSSASYGGRVGVDWFVGEVHWLNANSVALWR